MEGKFPPIDCIQDPPGKTKIPLWRRGNSLDNSTWDDVGITVGEEILRDEQVQRGVQRTWRFGDRDFGVLKFCCT